MGEGDGSLKLDAYLPYRLSVASNAVSGLIARAYEDRFGLSVPQWRGLCGLAEGGGLTPGQNVAPPGVGKGTGGRPPPGPGEGRRGAPPPPPHHGPHPPPA